MCQNFRDRTYMSSYLLIKLRACKNMAALAAYFALLIAGKILFILVTRFLIHYNLTFEQVATFDRLIEQKLAKPVVFCRV